MASPLCKTINNMNWGNSLNTVRIMDRVSPLAFKPIKHVKFLVPSLVMFGVVPHYFIIWVAWRFLSFILPASIYQAGDDLYYSLYQTLILFYSEHVIGTKYYFSGDGREVAKKKEKVVCISNHQSTVDWVIIHVLADRQGSLGHCRYVMKDSLQFVPLYGFYFYQHGCVYVKRHFFNTNKMVSALNYLKNPKIPTWMVIFPEGTRYFPDAKELVENSRSFAKDRDLVPLNHVLTPKFKGLYIALEHMKDNLDAVYDATIIYSCTKGNKKTLRTRAPSLFEFLSGGCDAVHIHVNRIVISDIPSEESKFKIWLHNLFLKKDKMLGDFYSNQPSPFSGGLQIPPNRLKHFGTALMFMSISAPVIFTSIGRSLWWKTWLIGSVCGYFWLGIRAVC